MRLYQCSDNHLVFLGINEPSLSHSCVGKCFREAIKLEHLLKASSTDEEDICSNDFKPHCKNKIRIDYAKDLKGGFVRDTAVNIFEELLAMNPILIALIASVSTAATLIFVGIITGISR